MWGYDEIEVPTGLDDTPDRVRGVRIGCFVAHRVEVGAKLWCWGADNSIRALGRQDTPEPFKRNSRPYLLTHITTGHVIDCETMEAALAIGDQLMLQLDFDVNTVDELAVAGQKASPEFDQWIKKLRALKTPEEVAANAWKRARIDRGA
jgi:hypothetical protein